MCGRFVQAADPEIYADMFHVDRVVAAVLPASYNVAPTDQVYAVAAHDGERLLGSFSWGLVPWWAKDRRIGARNINARVETVAIKAAFRDSLAGRRCLIPADGFYEWQARPNGKLPHYVHRGDGSPIAFAGLWASWKDKQTEQRLRTCTILTGQPNATVAPIHDRMPVMLHRAAWATWLDPTVTDPEVLLPLLALGANADLTAHPVSTLVNKVANNLPQLIEPLTIPAADPLPGG
ncbi:MAG: SOS response-associated peptidase [Acidimicrobiia bacterium]|nr:SOS response-associated peptidase [Acidimicrobiia bacterium]